MEINNKIQICTGDWEDWLFFRKVWCNAMQAIEDDTKMEGKKRGNDTIVHRSKRENPERPIKIQKLDGGPSFDKLHIKETIQLLKPMNVTIFYECMRTGIKAVELIEKMGYKKLSSDEIKNLEAKITYYTELERLDTNTLRIVDSPAHHKE